MAAGARFAGILLAAGESRRMGQPKALLHVGGARLIDRLVEVYLASGVRPLIVVGNEEIRGYAARLTGIVWVQGDPQASMIDSLARGIAAAGDSANSVLAQPIDAPFTTTTMIAKLTAGDPRATRVLCHQGRPGHPVLIGRSLFPEIEARPVGGLRTVLSLADAEPIEWEDDRIFADLDTPEDLIRLGERSLGHLH